MHVSCVPLFREKNSIFILDAALSGKEVELLFELGFKQRHPEAYRAWHHDLDVLQTKRAQHLSALKETFNAALDADMPRLLHFVKEQVRVKVLDIYP